MNNETTKEESFFDNIKSTLIQRFSTPLYLYIITAFCVENWDKILYVAFGGGTIDTRTSIVQMEGIHFWQPIAYGLVLTLIMPFLSRGIEWFHLLSDHFHCYLSSKRDTGRISSINGIKVLERQYEINRTIKEARHNSALDLIQSRKEFRTDKIKKNHEMLSKVLKIAQDNNSKAYETRNNLHSDLKRIYLYVDQIQYALECIADKDNVDNNPSTDGIKEHIIRNARDAIDNVDLKGLKKYLEDVNMLDKTLSREMNRLVNSEMPTLMND